MSAFLPEQVAIPGILALARKVKVTTDESMSLRRYDYPAARVSVALDDGRMRWSGQHHSLSFGQQLSQRGMIDAAIRFLGQGHHPLLDGLRSGVGRYPTSVLVGQSGRMVMLVGELGIGKSRTAQGLADHAGSLGCTVYFGAGARKKAVLRPTGPGFRP